MSASPTVAAQSTKRPLEDPSSPSHPNEQPDAKRPALDKIVKGSEETEMKQVADSIETPLVVRSNGAPEGEEEATNGTKDAQGDTVVGDAPREGTQPIETTAASRRSESAAVLQHDESGWIHVRSVISSAEAATVIGKGGENVTQIRKLSGAKCTVSDYQKGAVERILTVSGLVDHVAKVRRDHIKFVFIILTYYRPLVSSSEP